MPQATVFALGDDSIGTVVYIDDKFVARLHEDDVEDGDLTRLLLSRGVTGSYNTIYSETDFHLISDEWTHKDPPTLSQARQILGL